MFSPSGRLSQFSGKKRLEDVLLRYVNLQDHDRGGPIQNQEYLNRTLKKLKCENDMASHLASPSGVSSSVEELQHEISRFQHQLQMAEQRLRIFEPDPLQITSISEAESREKFLVEALARVTHRKKYLQGNHLPQFDPSHLQMYLEGQEGVSTSFDNQNVNWIAQNNHHNSMQMLLESDPMHSLRDPSQSMQTSMYEALSHETNLPMDHHLSDCHLKTQVKSDGGQLESGTCNMDYRNPPHWQQGFSATELMSLIPNSFPLMQHVDPTGMQLVQPHHQQQEQTPASCSHLTTSSEGATFESPMAELNHE